MITRADEILTIEDIKKLIDQCSFSELYELSLYIEEIKNTLENKGE